jgi:hypothetical protein
MIILNCAVATGIVTLSQPAVIKLGADVPVVINFDVAPGSVSSIQFALGSDATIPTILAYTDTFSASSSTVWTGLLDASDTRLVSNMSTLGSDTVIAELAVTIDGVEQVSPNLSVAVQQPIIVPPAASEGGPSYYTETQTNTAIAAAVAAALLNATGILAITGAGDANLTWGAGIHNFIGAATVAAGSGAYASSLVLQSGNRVAGDRVELRIPVPASANPTINIYDGTDAGTLLATILPDAVTARTYLLTAYFDGTQWQLFSLLQQV